MKGDGGHSVPSRIISEVRVATSHELLKLDGGNIGFGRVNAGTLCEFNFLSEPTIIVGGLSRYGARSSQFGQDSTDSIKVVTLLLFLLSHFIQDRFDIFTDCLLATTLVIALSRCFDREFSITVTLLIIFELGLLCLIKSFISIWLVVSELNARRPPARFECGCRKYVVQKTLSFGFISNRIDKD